MQRFLDQYDALIIGGGYAGMSAALWLGRYHRSAAVVSEGPVRNAASTVMHGYPGLDGRAPADLLQNIKREAAGYGAVFIDGRAESAAKTSSGFIIKTSSGTYSGKKLLVATGTEDIQPVSIPGFTRFRGRTAWHCPACDGHEYTGCRIAINGWHEHIAGYAKEFLAYTTPQKICIVTHGHAAEIGQSARQEAAKAGIAIIDDPLAELRGSGSQLEKIVFEGGRSIPVDAFFYNIGQKPRLGLLGQLGCKMADSAVQVDNCQETSVRGVYAAGDIIPSEDLVVVACASGAVAAGSIHDSLLEAELA